jgi:hypothetical protein
MSALAKVFVVVNFVLSLLFFGTAATLFLTREDYRSAHETFVVKSKDQLKLLQDEILKQKGLLEQQSNIIDLVVASETQLAKDLTDKKASLQAKDAEIQEANSSRDTATTAKTQVLRNMEEKEKTVRELNDRLQQANEKSETASNERKLAVEERNRMKADLDKANTELAGMRVDFTGLEEKLASLELIVADCEKRFGGPIPHLPPPPIDAQVEDVDAAQGLVVLSAGRDQKVKTGYEFTVYRGAKFVGKVRVTRVFDDLSGAEIVFTAEGASIERGDRASTALNVGAVLR